MGLVGSRREVHRRRNWHFFTREGAVTAAVRVPVFMPRITRHTKGTMSLQGLRDFEVLPTQDAAFKMLFTERTDLGVLASLINAVRADRAPVSALTIVNPEASPRRPKGKRIILDVKAKDAQGNDYNVEMQVRRQAYWGDRALVYLAYMIAGQLKAGQDYQGMPSAVRIDLLDFDLFRQKQAVWSFAMRDENVHDQVLSEAAEIRVIEMPKYERLGWNTSALSDWVKFFKHSKDAAIMETVTTPEVKRASSAFFDMSLDERTRMRLFEDEVYERDRLSERRAAVEEGLAKGREEGREEGLAEGQEKVALNLILKTAMDNATIAAMCNLEVKDVARLREQHRS
jgi:predicted transposase/invertase (TIGR01784 family)